MSLIHMDPQPPEKAVKACVDGLMTLCKSLNIQQLEGVGLSVPGIVDSETRFVEFAPNFGWEKFDIGEAIHKLLPGISNVSIGNGANVSALAELWFGSHEVDLTNFLYISVHPGIGSGIIIGNNLVEGEHNASGEIGHMVIFPGGEPCACGNNGCLEAYASDKATLRRYAMEKYGTADDHVDCELQDIIDLAQGGDEIAAGVIKKTGYYLGLGIANIVKAIDPHVIIIGGQITKSWDLIYPEIKTVVLQQAYFGRRDNVEILPTSLKLPPRLLGAATLAIEMMFDEYSISD